VSGARIRREDSKRGQLTIFQRPLAAVFSSLPIQALLARFTKCWKPTAADSQDSFCLPDAASEIYQPPLRSENLKPIRNSLAAWLPDPERKNMFAGWTIFGLKKDSKVSQGLSDIVLKRYRYPKREDGSSSWARHIRILM
jgi:hypothetical protein